MATYAVSDIHGCFDELMAALERVGFSSSDDLYVLGDMIDRGPKVGECVEWLVSQDANGGDSDSQSNVHFLLGNHEQMADWSFMGRWSRFRFDIANAPLWKRNGGDKTIDQLRGLSPDVVDAFQRIVQRAPKGVALRMDHDMVLLCHAGIRPPDALTDDGEWLVQAEDDLLWIGAEWYADDVQAPFHVVSGHVPTVSLCRDDGMKRCPEEVLYEGLRARMMHWGCRHDIDCGCVFGGNLGILRLDDWEGFHVPCFDDTRRLRMARQTGVLGQLGMNRPDTQ